MAIPLVFQFHGEDSACHLSKVERSKLYSYVEKEVLDENEQKCRLATLASDGRTLIGSGGSTFAYMSPDGLWCEKSELQAVDLENVPVTPSLSSFKAPVELEQEASLEDYLSHNVRSVYVLDSPDGFSDKLVNALKDGEIFPFPFSYRGGLEPDEGFPFQGPDDVIWLALGKPADIRMVRLSEGGAAVTEESENGDEEDVDIMDFGLI